MKSLFFFLAVLVITLVYNNVEVEAACPSGYTSETVTVNISTGCVAMVEYCYLEVSPGIYDIRIGNISVDYYCLPLASDFWQKISNGILDDFPGEIPNCPQTITNIILNKVACTKFVNDIQNYQVKIVACEDAALCKSHFKLCYDTDFNPPRLVKQHQISFLQGTPDCQTGPIDYSFLNTSNWTESECYTSCIYQ